MENMIDLFSVLAGFFYIYKALKLYDSSLWRNQRRCASMVLYKRKPNKVQLHLALHLHKDVNNRDFNANLLNSYRNIRLDWRKGRHFSVSGSILDHYASSLAPFLTGSHRVLQFFNFPIFPLLYPPGVAVKASRANCINLKFEKKYYNGFLYEA